MQTKADVMTELAPIFRDVFLLDSVHLQPEMQVGDILGWDSLSHISLLYAVQEHFQIKLTTREIEALRDLGDLAACISAKTE